MASLISHTQGLHGKYLLSIYLFGSGNDYSRFLSEKKNALKAMAELKNYNWMWISLSSNKEFNKIYRNFNNLLAR